MFRLTFFVEDKDLAKCLRAIAGMTFNMEPPQPVVNARKTSTGLKAQTTGHLRDLVMRVLIQQKTKNVTTTQITKICTDLGFHETSVGYVIKTLTQIGFLRRSGRGKYSVNQTLKTDKTPKRKATHVKAS